MANQLNRSAPSNGAKILLAERERLDAAIQNFTTVHRKPHPVGRRQQAFRSIVRQVCVVVAIGQEFKA